MNVWFQKMSILPLQKGLEIPGGGSSQRPKWGGILGKNPFCGGYGYFLEPHNMSVL